MPGSSQKDPYVVEYGTDLHLRTLSDGSHYRVIKVMYEPGQLESLIAGWSVEIDATRWFIFGSARQSLRPRCPCPRARGALPGRPPEYGAILIECSSWSAKLVGLWPRPVSGSLKL